MNRRIPIDGNMYDRTVYIAKLPADVRQGIRKAVARILSTGGGSVYYMGDFVDYGSLPTRAKTEILDEIMSGRLSDIEGIDHGYWLDKANATRKSRR